jgi:hypothetical protein
MFGKYNIDINIYMKKRSLLNASCLKKSLKILQFLKKTASHGVDDRQRWINPKGESGAMYLRLQHQKNCILQLHPLPDNRPPAPLLILVQIYVGTAFSATVTWGPVYIGRNVSRNTSVSGLDASRDISNRRNTVANARQSSTHARLYFEVS